MYQHRSEAAFFAKRVTEQQHRRHTILERFGNFEEAPENVLQILDYPGTLPKSCSGYFLRFTTSTFKGGKALKSEEYRTLCSLIVSAGEERRAKRKEDARRAR